MIDVGAAARAQTAGIHVIMDRCLYKEYRRLFHTDLFLSEEEN